MRIIIIDDLQENQKSAEQLREDGHEVTIFGDAMEALSHLRLIDRGEEALPDMLLTDLWMPTAAVDGEVNRVMYLQDQDDHYREATAVGLPIAIAARNAGVAIVGIFTDSDHHRDQTVALCELFNASSTWWRPEDKVKMRNRIGLYEARNHKNPDGSKNWSKLVRKIMG